MVATFNHICKVEAEGFFEEYNKLVFFKINGQVYMAGTVEQTEAVAKEIVKKDPFSCYIKAETILASAGFPASAIEIIRYLQGQSFFIDEEKALVTSIPDLDKFADAVIADQGAVKFMYPSDTKQNPQEYRLSDLPDCCTDVTLSELGLKPSQADKVRLYLA